MGSERKPPLRCAILPAAIIGQQTLQRAVLQRCPRITAVVIARIDHTPAFMALAVDEGHTRFALGGERVEPSFEPLFGGFARVDRAAESRTIVAIPRMLDFTVTFHGCVHELAPVPIRKKLTPLQCDPMIFLATALSEAYRSPS